MIYKRLTRNQYGNDMPSVRRVLLDTNCLVYSIQQKLDLFSHIEETFAGSEIRIEVPTGVLAELGSLTAGKGKDAHHASVALSLLKKKIAEGKASAVKSVGNVDGWLVREGRKNRNITVCTYDARLKKYLKELGAQIMSPRGRGRH